MRPLCLKQNKSGKEIRCDIREVVWGQKSVGLGHDFGLTVRKMGSQWKDLSVCF